MLRKHVIKYNVNTVSLMMSNVPFWLACSITVVWSRSALILQTSSSSSVFQAPQKRLATVFTWQIPPRPDRAHGTHVHWIVDSSSFRSAFLVRPSQLNALPPLSFQVLRQKGCNITPGSFTALSLLRLGLISELFRYSALIVHSFSPSYSAVTSPPGAAHTSKKKRTTLY